ncbi:MAG: hypothetical protein ACRDXC_13390, partial [Acidimicrobiales bacterium]
RTAARSRISPGADTSPDTSAEPRPAAARDIEVDRAISDYDALAASQVVRRLDGLAQDELRAVVRHELATRGRRTILHRAEQLLGAAPDDLAPGEPGEPAGGATP